MNFNGKTILITGGTGSWGQELTKQLITKYRPAEIRIYSRGELAQVNMKRKFDAIINERYIKLTEMGDKRIPQVDNIPFIKYIIGDVRSLNRLNMAMKDVDIVFHLAALKHVPICEENEWECVNTNIMGVENVIRSSINNSVDLVVDVSTDKACNPLNTYGACKSVGEKLVLGANQRDGQTRFVCIRAGNVIGSNGSVIPFFIDQAKKKEPLPITHSEMTRYLMTLSDAIGLVFKAALACRGGEIFVTKMFGAKIVDVAIVIDNFYTPNQCGEESLKEWKNRKFPEIGIRPGEKIDEMLVSEHESLYTVEDNNFRIILPMDGSLDSNYKKYKKMKEHSYTSDDILMNYAGIENILIKSGFLK